ncbi:MAG: InlB B-repeat-containing protein, partial [Fibrobacter sp.]|nr:InlB B-repeat-containing protein [Fibrobacter sp.]
MVITAIMLLSMIPLGTLAEIVSGFSSGFSMSKAAPFVHTKTYEFWVEGDGIPTKLVDTQIVKNGQSLIAPATPEAPDGTKFTGWFVGNDKVLFNDPIEVNANTPDKVEAKAKFTPVAYVYFVYNGNVIATKEVPPGTKTDSSGVPITVNIPGKVLSHWSDTVDGSAFDFAGTNIDGDTSLYAVLIDQWEVSFNTHGGTTILPQYVVHNGKATKPSDNPTRLGYTFKHWSTTENGAQAYSFNTSVTDKLTLHAVWNAGNANYSVVYWMQDIDDTDNT